MDTSIIENIQCVHTCCRCQKKIKTHWVNGQLDGQFMALYAIFSDLFEDWLPDMKTVVCLRCYMKAEKKNK